MLQFVAKLLQPIAQRMRYGSSPKLASQVITRILLNAPAATGVYYDERGQPMQASAQVSDPRFQSRIVSETRLLLAGH